MEQHVALCAVTVVAIWVLQVCMSAAQHILCRMHPTARQLLTNGIVYLQVPQISPSSHTGTSVHKSNEVAAKAIDRYGKAHLLHPRSAPEIWPCSAYRSGRGFYFLTARVQRDPSCRVGLPEDPMVSKVLLGPKSGSLYYAGSQGTCCA